MLRYKHSCEDSKVRNQVGLSVSRSNRIGPPHVSRRAGAWRLERCASAIAYVRDAIRTDSGATPVNLDKCGWILYSERTL